MVIGGLEDWIKNAAFVNINGLDPIQYLSTVDPLQRMLMQEIASQSFDLIEKMMDNLAVAIAREVSNLFKK